MSFQLTLDAELDIEEIYLYSLANFGEKKADQYHSELTEHLLSIVDNPKIGRDFSFVKAEIYRSNYVSHAVYYRIIRSSIIILRVLHQQMDPARHL